MHGRGELGLWDTLDAVGGWFRRLSGNAPDPEIKRTPPGSGRTARGARLREPSQAHLSALKLRCSRLRPFQAGIPGAPVARARALACPARPSGSERGWFPEGEGGCFFPGLAPWAILRNPQGHLRPVSGPAAGMSAKFVSIGMDRGGGGGADCRPSAPHQGLPGNRQAVHTHSLTYGQKPEPGRETPVRTPDLYYSPESPCQQGRGFSEPWENGIGIGIGIAIAVAIVIENCA